MGRKTHWPTRPGEAFTIEQTKTRRAPAFELGTESETFSRTLAKFQKLTCIKAATTVSP